MSEPIPQEPLSHKNLAKRSHEMLKRMANTENLTGLLNQRGIISTTEQVLSNLNRVGLGTTFSVTMLDMIGLKALNKQYTELGANKFIKLSADATSRTVRKSDLVGRWGGDEFVIISFDTDSAGVSHLIDNVKNAQPPEIKFNAVYKLFNSKADVPLAIDEVFGNIEKVKATLPQDKTGRSIGTGVTVELE